jgi:hypothetical protein
VTETEAATAPRQRRSWIGWLLLGLLALYAGFVHHGFGAVPETFDLAWYNPRSFMIYFLQANTPLDPWNRPTLTLAIALVPAIALALGAGLALRSSLGRVLALTLVFATLLFLRAGISTPLPWRIYQWLFSALILSVALSLASGILAPLLAGSWLRLRWGLRLLVYLPIFALAIGLMRNATGFDPRAPLNLSLWPTVPFFGFQVVDAYLALAFCGVALVLTGVAARSLGVRAWGAAAAGGLLLVVGLATVGGTGWAPAGVVSAASGLAIYAGRRIPRGTSRAHAPGLRTGVAALLISLPLFVGQGLVERDYAQTQHGRAQQMIDALAAYYAAEEVYPESLQVLVDEKRLDSIPRPAIGFRLLSDPEFSYQSFGDNYLLEFSAPGWVQCQYNPPWIDDFEARGFQDESYQEGDEGGVWQCPPPRPPDFF